MTNTPLPSGLTQKEGTSMYVKASLVALLTSAIIACDGPAGNLSTELPNAHSLESGDRVRLNGVDIGNVADIELQSNGVLVRLDINRETMKIIDSKATTRVMGGNDPYLIIKNPSTTSTPAERDTVLAAAPESTLSNLTEGGLGEALSGILGSLQDNIEGQDWAELSQNLEKTVEDLTRNGTALNKSLGNTLGNLIEGFEGDVEELIPEIEAMSRELAEQLGGESTGLQSAIVTIFGQLADSVARGIEKGQQN